MIFDKISSSNEKYEMLSKNLIEEPFNWTFSHGNFVKPKPDQSLRDGIKENLIFFYFFCKIYNNNFIYNNTEEINMENKVKFFYNNMCYECRQSFKKIVNGFKGNLNNLVLFSCYIDKKRTINDDNGVVPLAFISCKNDSYVFFSRDTLYNADGLSKIKIINNSVKLSKDTIENIKKTNELLVVKKEQNGPIVTKQIDENEYSLQKSFNRQLAVINHQHLLRMSKIKKMILSIGLIIILLLISAGGTLGWYFINLENRTGSNDLPVNNNRINLSEHFKSVQLGNIKDNREETILAASKEKNSNLKVDDLYIKDITIISATVLVKSSSNLYLYDSSVQVFFIPKYKTLSTDLKIINFPNLLPETEGPYEPSVLLQIVKKFNSDLLLHEIKIGNIRLNTEKIISAVITTNENSAIYLPNSKEEIYFTKNNKKLLSEILINRNIGDVINKEEKNILNKVGEKNTSLDLEQIEIFNDSITEKSSLIRVKKDSKDYIFDDKKIEVFFRIFNPNIGKIKSEVTTINDVTNIAKMIYLKNNTILVAANNGLYLLNSDGTLKKKLSDCKIQNKQFNFLMQLSDNTILASYIPDYGENEKNVIYHLNEDGSVIEIIKNNSNISFYSFFQVKDDLVLANDEFGYIYHLNSSGKMISDDPITKLPAGRIISFIKLEDDKLFAVADEKLFILNMKGELIKELSYGFVGVTDVLKLQNGIILLISGGEYIHHLNEDGMYIDSEQVYNEKISHFVQNATGNIFGVKSKSNIIYELHNI
ncbi:hypothetical protein [Spiroplasma chrysopicola]|uniref:Uncharacterized protein n=1 Tax=Spiroplasma chrysopicola DF-1 TaxID=1276227 RepID=R4UGQ7_9MOLU|nr:hypothetical protein [Spiroplasma chrysopicola]AGM25325.1 hypothetical protein SCHRY_v1c07490 [Spiroplasma chrysopicola DF-1]